MAERRFPGGARDDVERSLDTMGKRVEWPVVPDLSARVREEIERPRRLNASSKAVSFRAAALVAAAVLILSIGALTILPEARTAIADRLGLRGLEIRWLDESPSMPPSPVDSGLDLGRATTLEAARQESGFAVLLPASDRLAAPVKVFVDDRDGNTLISIVYPAGKRLPEGEIPGIGALLTQFRGETNHSLILKGLGDSGGQGKPNLESVTVNGGPGFWISGAPHGAMLACTNGGECPEQRYRLAGNVLVWEQDGLTLRFESALTRDQALEIAESMRAAE